MTRHDFIGLALSLFFVGGLLYWAAKDMPKNAFMDDEEDQLGIPDAHYRLLRLLGSHTRESDRALNDAAFIDALTQRWHEATDEGKGREL
jgi:hypothetical protein